MSEAKERFLSFRMRQLPKPEYKLLKTLVAQYGLKDDSEAVLIALRMVHEVIHFKGGQGELWLKQVIETYRANPTEVRSYELSRENA